jgi:protein gp37
VADRSAIEWCDSTFNPWIGCTKVSPACDHCYAEVSMPSRTRGVAWGAGKPRQRTSAANWKLPLRWNSERFMQCTDCGWRGATPCELVGCGACGSVDVVDTRRRVFCASLADVFDNEVDTAWRDDLATLILDTPELDWLLLTKRIGNAAQMLDAMFLDGSPPNVWIGATICNQAEADRDIPKLLRVPAAVRFLSIEPMLGPINLRNLLFYDTARTVRAIDWVIVGGESGPHARPMHPEWVRSVRDQCAAAGVPFLFKQWGEWLPSDAEDQPVYRGEHCYIGGP